MKKKNTRWLAVGCIGLLTSLAFVSLAASAQTPRLSLAITESFGNSDGSQCNLPAGAHANASATRLTLSENDVVSWDFYGALWTLDSRRFTPEVATAALVNHCFVLSIDGKALESGVVLPVDTGHLTGYSTLNVIPANGVVRLQLTRGNHHNIRLLHAEALGAVLGRRAPVDTRDGITPGATYAHP